jgi:hypothetical protein
VADAAADVFDPNPDQRAAILAPQATRNARLLLLDRPAGIEGHAGGADGRFPLRYGPCRLHFAAGRRTAG